MKRRKWLRIASIAAASALALVMLIFGFLQTGIGQRLVASTIESAASSETFKIKIEGLEGTLPGSPSAAKVTLADAQGPWLVLHDVRADWSPFALIFGEIAVGEIAVARADWIRQPTGSDETSSDDGGLPSLSIGRFNFATVRVAREVANTPGTLSIEGALDLTDPPDAATISVKAAEIGGGARLSADIRYALADSLLAANVDVHDRAGGVLAALIGLPADAPLSIQLTSTGGLDDWRAKLTARGGGALSADGTATIRRDGDWWLLNVAFDAELAKVGPAAWRPLVEGHTRLTLAAGRSVGGGNRIDALRLESPNLRLDARGVLDPDAEIASGNATLLVGDGKRFVPLLGEGLTWRTLSATARLSGGWPKPVLHVEATGSDVHVDDVKAGKLTLVADATPDRPWHEGGLGLAVAARANAEGVDSEDETLKDILGPTVALTMQTEVADYARFSNATMVLSAAIGVARFTGDAGDGSVAGDVTLDAPDLARAGAVGGRALLRAHVTFERATSAWRVEGAATAHNAAIGDRAIDGLLKGEAELGFAARGPSFQAASISKLSLTGAQISAEADGDITADTLDLDATLTVPDVSVVDRDLGGRAEARLHLSGSSDAPRIDGTVSIAQGKVRGQASQLLVLRLDEADANGISALSLAGDLGGKAVSGKAAVAWNDPAGVRFDRAGVAVGAVALDGALLVSGGLLSGALAVSAEALQDVAPLIGEDVAGQAAGKLTFAVVGQRQMLDVALTSADARIDTVRTGGLILSGRIVDPFGAAALDLRAQAASADFDGLALTKVDATAKGALKALDLSAKGMRTDTAVSLQARLDVDERPTRVALSALSLSRADKSARLAAPVALTIADGRVAIPSARIVAGGGQLTATGIAGSEMDLSLRAERLPLWVADLAGETLPVTGAATGTLTMRGPARELRSTFDIKIADLTPRDAREVARNLTLAASGATDRNGAQFKATLSDPRGTTLTASGRVPFNDAGALAVDAQGTAELALANVYLAATGDRARGKLSVSAKVSGTLAQPRVSGTGTIKDGFFRSAQAGLELRDVEARLEGSERRIAVTELSAKAPNGGTVTGRGEIRLDGAAGFPIDLALKAANAQLVATDITTVAAEVDVRMSGGLMRNPVIRGSVDIAQWDIRVPERLARPLTPIRVTHRNAPAHIGQLPAERDDGESAFSFALDLTVRAPRRVFVRGQGIDAEFGGNAKVTGTVDDPIVNGRFNLRRGAISLLSERVALTRGAVVFTGPVEPMLDVAGTITKSDITATIAAKGKASDPVLTLSSVPTLPQDEILARILFRKGTQQLSAFEAAQVAQAIAKWSGLSAGPDILDKLRTVLGIDALSATTDASGATAVSAGSYVGSGVFLGMTQGAGTAAGSANAEVDLTENIKLRGEVNATGNTKLGVAAEWEY